MGKPSSRNGELPHTEYIGVKERTRGSETSQYPEEKKTTSDSGSSGERTRKNKPKPTFRKRRWGCGSTVGPWVVSGSAWKGVPKRVIVSYAKTTCGRVGYPSTTEHVQFCLNLPGPSGKAKYYSSTDSVQVPRGKGEKNPCEGSQKNLKPHVYKQFEHHAARQVRERTFCIMIRRLNVRSEAKPIGGAGAKASPKWATSCVYYNPKRDDLRMARLKCG